MSGYRSNGYKEYDKKQQKHIKPVLFFRTSRATKTMGGIKMQRFWELVKSSVIVQGTVTLALVTTTCYLYATGQTVPESLLSLDGLVIGFFFGSKIQQVAARKVGK